MSSDIKEQEKTILKHFRFTKEDQENLLKVKEEMGLLTDSQAVRIAVRKYAKEILQ